VHFLGFYYKYYIYIYNSLSDLQHYIYNIKKAVVSELYISCFIITQFLSFSTAVYTVVSHSTSVENH